MKKLFLLLIFILNSATHAASIFTGNGEIIHTIFNSPKVWNKLGGPVQSIILKGHSNKKTTYSVTTLERIRILDAEGLTQDYKDVPCTIIVDVTATGDAMAPTLKVSNVDFSACPQTEFN